MEDAGASSQDGVEISYTYPPADGIVRIGLGPALPHE
jgi:hypothetical protein